MFKTEREMVDLLANNMQAFELNQGLDNYEYAKRFSEVDLGYGIADLVIARYKMCQIRQGESLSKFDIAVYMVFERDRSWLTASNVHERTRAAIHSVVLALNKLVKEGYIRVKEGVYKFYRKYKSVITTSIAIEAKLSDWKRALKQAYRYNWFSNYSFVVLPKNKSQGALTNLALFKKMKVGLATISLDGKLEILYTPRRTKPYDASMAYLLNENLLGKWLKKAEPS